MSGACRLGCWFDRRMRAFRWMPAGFSDPARYPQPPPDMPRPYGTRDQNGPVPFTEPEEFAGML